VSLVGPNQVVPKLVTNNVPSPAVADYIDGVMGEYDDGDMDKKRQIIMTQKWIQRFGSEVDPYTDYRRTGYPVLYDPRDPAMAPDGFAHPPPSGDPNQAVQKPVPVIQSVPYPLSLPWVRDELQVNPNAAAQKKPETYKPFWLP